MLYDKNRNNPQLDKELFKNPTAEYRGTPFWAWNCELDEKELLRQIDVFKEMGLGGFHMHVRTGMATAYLSDEFMKLIRSCTDHAKKNNMLAWLYDEDRWPSGAAGGIVTKNPEYRQRMIRFSCDPNYKMGKYHSNDNSQSDRARQYSFQPCFFLFIKPEKLFSFFLQCADIEHHSTSFEGFCVK